MDMQFFIETIKSGGIYDILKIGGVGVVKELAAKLRDILGVQSFSTQEYDKLAEIIEKIDKTYLLAEDIFIAYLKNSEELKKFLDDKKSGSNNSRQETHGANSPIFKDVNGNITLNYGVDIEKK